MAAAYGALVSLMHLIYQIEHHPFPPIRLNKDQVESLTERVTFLQYFLEVYNFHEGNHEVECLRSRVAKAAYAAEDAIESRVVDQIHAQTTSTRDGEISTYVYDFYQHLQKVIEDMDFIKKEVMEIRKKTGIENHMQRNSTPAFSSTSPSTGQHIMVGFDDDLYEMLDKLTGQQPSRQIIPIVGMGGIGKTTLAKNIYENSLIVQHFDIRAWTTISQEYSIREILLEVLLCLNNNQLSRKDLSEKSEDELGESLYRSLCGRRYLIVMDDMWNIDPWNKIKLYFPDSNSGSRIVTTTWISKVATSLTDTGGLELNLLDKERSWNLLRKIVFGEEDCPLELEKLGEKIAKNCKGLPLSIVVIGGLLAKSKELNYWKYVAENLNSIVNLEDNERCLKILYTSYKLLPIHLKPCFFYMGIFPEDTKIRVADIIKLWVDEGFLKSISGKSLEVVAEEYLKDLIDRNLILIHESGSLLGKIKSCTIHDLLRDLCLREAHKDKFLCVTNQVSLKFPEGRRRFAIYGSALVKVEEFGGEVYHSSKLSSFARSLICDFDEMLPLLNFRLLRVLKAVDLGVYDEATFHLVNMRHLAIKPACTYTCVISLNPSVCLLWNLQTLIVNDVWQTMSFVAPIEIWKMPLLRHLKFLRLSLPDPPDKQDYMVLGNLQTLSIIKNFKCGEEVVKRIPNVKKLKLSYEGNKLERYCLHNLGHLQKLESLTCEYIPFMTNPSDAVQNLSFPHSLKKLTLAFGKFYWEDMSKIGSLPLLQVLKLDYGSFVGRKWETVDGQFRSLRRLQISRCDVQYWATEGTHFPRLEHLFLFELNNLKEIPMGFGDIATLKSIVLTDCCDSVITSAKRILEEQEEFGNEELQLKF